MPFIHPAAILFKDVYAKVPPERENATDYEYLPLRANFRSTPLNPIEEAVIKALQGAGFTHVRVAYDGGVDENLSYPERFIRGDESLSLEKTVSILCTPDVSREFCEAELKAGFSLWKTDESPEAAVDACLRDVCGGWAIVLLGKSYGTGPPDLYGAFTADLMSGEILDDPAATKPPLSYFWDDDAEFDQE